MPIKEINSDVTVRNLRIPPARIEIKVKNSPGLFLRASPRGKFWYLRARPPGENNPIAVKIGPYGRGERAFTLKEAREKAEQWKEDIKGGIDPRFEVKQAKATTFTVVVDEFLARGKTAKGEPWKPSTAAAYRSTLKSPRYRKWSESPVSKLTDTQVQEAINKMEEEGKYTGARRNLAYLQTFFGWCRKKKQGYIPASHALPTDGVELEELEGLFRQLYRFDQRASVFNKQQTHKPLVRVRRNTESQLNLTKINKRNLKTK